MSADGIEVVEHPLDTEALSKRWREILADGVFAPDVLWCTDDFWAARRGQTPLESAPAICVEVAPPSNTLQDLHAKVRAYLDAGATEGWLVFPRSKRVEFHGRSGPAPASSFTVDLSTLFD